MNVIRQMKMFLNETYSRVWVGKYFTDKFPIKKSLKQVDGLSLLLYNFTLEYTNKWVQANRDGLKLYGTYKSTCGLC